MRFIAFLVRNALAIIFMLILNCLGRNHEVIMFVMLRIWSRN